ncbi:MAG: hypothetical protein HYX87_00365 [Chloroflexi bacterium]|nr:hypothetical protein [Chloroflexota bacterium]
MLGGTPYIGLTSVTKFPYGTDECLMAGGIAREPLRRLPINSFVSILPLYTT